MRLHDNAVATTLSTATPATHLQSHTALKKTASKEEQAAQESADQKKVSEGVESMFVRQMLEASHMFDGVGGHPMMQGMMLEKLSDAVVKGGNLGIGDYVTGKQPGADAGPPRTVHDPQASSRSHANAADDGGMIGSVDELALLHASSKTMATKTTKHADFAMMDMGMGMDLSIDVGDFALPDDLLPKAAQDAVDEGRVPGLGKDASVAQALGRSWTPVVGAPQDDTGVIPLAQADSNATLGTGPKTIRQAGCLLTSMAMTSNALTGARNGVDAANQIVTAAGGFDGNNMKIDVAAKALGLKLASRGAFNGDTSAMDASLSRGRPVVVGVDFKDGTSSSLGRTDHFLVVTGRAPGGGYTAIDSANGRSLTFERDGQGALRAGKYDLAEVVTLEPSAAAFARASRVRAGAFSFAGFDG
jgi:Rod binding domain-containing protein